MLLDSIWPLPLLLNPSSPLGAYSLSSRKHLVKDSKSPLFLLQNAANHSHYQLLYFLAEPDHTFTTTFYARRLWAAWNICVKEYTLCFGISIWIITEVLNGSNQMCCYSVRSSIYLTVWLGLEFIVFRIFLKIRTHSCNLLVNLPFLWNRYFIWTENTEIFT